MHRTYFWTCDKNIIIMKQLKKCRSTILQKRKNMEKLQKLDINKFSAVSETVVLVLFR